MRERFAIIVRVARSTSPNHSGWSLLGYYMLLVTLTDCVMWYESGNLVGYDWRSLVLYSLMSYPLWMLVGIKGVAKEQVDLMESDRWHAADLLPGGSTAVFIGHYIGKVLKTRALVLWLVVYVGLAFYHGASLLIILIALCNLAVGSINLANLGIAAKMYAPKGYSAVISAIVGNFTWLLSGAVFPLGMITQSPIFYLFNPFSATVSTPLSLLQSETVDAMAVQVYCLIGSLVWFVLLFLLTSRAERSQRARIYG